MSQSIQYRPEIDGLRALAVIAVVIYHAELMLNGKAMLPGGYLGVDIFFVISGYLITKIIVNEIQGNKFSIVKFYIRRSRRILPALFVMMLISVPLSWKYLLPADYIEYSQSIISTLFFSSNIFFWLEAGYFDSPNEIKPLIHTWSLAVEEQFYLFFPLLLIVLKSSSRQKILFIVILGFFFSLAAAQLSSVHYPSGNFYLLPTRGWELLAGSILALTAGFSYTSKPLNQVISALALAMILIPMYMFTADTAHPSLLTLIPVVGTCIIIANNNQSSITYKFLSAKLLVGIGLISYSLYLWHQPILVFSRLEFGANFDLAEKIIAILLSVFFAYISWRLIETPFRNNRILNTKLFAGILLTGFFALMIAAIVGITAQGFPQRFDKDDYLGIVKLTKTKESRKLEQNRKICFGRLPNNPCTFGEADATTRIILIGDSHAGSLAPALSDAIIENSMYLATSNTTSCPYIPGFSPEKFPDCDKVLNVIRSKVLENDSFNTVILHSRLQIHVEGDRYDNQEGGRESGPRSPLILTGNPSASDSERLRLMQKQLNDTVHTLLASGKKVILIYPVPEVGWSVPRMLRANLPRELEKRIAWLNKGGINTSHSVFKERNKRTYKILNAIGEHPNLIRIYPEKIFCNTYISERCVTHTSNQVFYEDDDHLSRAGADLVIKELMKVIK
jgi:peptidoglycan/LPS O-acetylase OafA/YrhL